jgi:hypothetical protein
MSSLKESGCGSVTLTVATITTLIVLVTLGANRCNSGSSEATNSQIRPSTVHVPMVTKYIEVDEVKSNRTSAKGVNVQSSKRTLPARRRAYGALLGARDAAEAFRKRSK